MSLITMGWAHLTVITMGLGQGFRIHRPMVRLFQYGKVRCVDLTPEIEEIDEEIKVTVSDVDSSIGESHD